MKLNKYNRVLNLILPIITILVIILIWLLGAVIVNEPIILPTPFKTITSIISLLGTKVFWGNLLGTLGRSLVAFFVSFILGLGFAIAVKFSNVSKPNTN